MPTTYLLSLLYFTAHSGLKNEFPSCKKKPWSSMKIRKTRLCFVRFADISKSAWNLLGAVTIIRDYCHLYRRPPPPQPPN